MGVAKCVESIEGVPFPQCILKDLEVFGCAAESVEGKHRVFSFPVGPVSCLQAVVFEYGHPSTAEYRKELRVGGGWAGEFNDQDRDR